MSREYRAWTFDPVAFHRWLDARVSDCGEFYPMLLREVAVEVAGGDSPTSVEYLECFGLRKDDHESWGEAFHDTAFDHRADWYVFSMAGHMAPCPRPSIQAYGRLQWLLPMARISCGACRTGNLLNGLSLRWLVEEYGDESLHPTLGWELRTTEVTPSSGGGWLSAEGVRWYRRLLETPPIVGALDGVGLTEADVPTFYNDLRQINSMLDTAIEREAALRMVIAR